MQPDLAATLAQIRVAGVGDLYQGALARRLEQQSPLVGGPLSLRDLRGALPTLAPALIEPWHSDKVAFLPPPADGGLAAAAAFETLRAATLATIGRAAARALAVAARWRQGGVTADALLKDAALPQAGLPPLPASTTWATLDHDGNAVVCAVSMDNLFGTGRIVPGLGLPAGGLAGQRAAAAAMPRRSRGTSTARLPRRGRRLRPGGAPLAVAVGMAEHADHRCGDGGAGARSRARQCHRLRRLPAGQSGKLPLGHRSARRRARGRQQLSLGARMVMRH